MSVSTLLPSGDTLLPPGTRIVAEIPDTACPSGYRVETPGINSLVASVVTAVLARLRAEKAAKAQAAAQASAPKAQAAVPPGPPAQRQPASTEKRRMGGSIRATVFIRRSSGGAWKPLRSGMARHITLLECVKRLNPIYAHEVEFTDGGRTVRMTTAEYLAAFGDVHPAALPDGKGAARG